MVSGPQGGDYGHAVGRLMRTVAIVQARLGSTRLPRKVLADLGGRPMIAHTLERAVAIPGIDEVVLAIPFGETALAEVGRSVGAMVVEGPEADVLARVLWAAEQTQADVIVRLTGDCPLIDPFLADRLLRLGSGIDYAGDLRRPGLDVEVVRRPVLDWLALHGSAVDREHVTVSCRDRLKVPFTRRMWTLTLPGWPWLAVDTADDLERVRAVAAHLPTGATGAAATFAAWEAAGRP